MKQNYQEDNPQQATQVNHGQGTAVNAVLINRLDDIIGKVERLQRTVDLLTAHLTGGDPIPEVDPPTTNENEEVQQKPVEEFTV